MQRVQRVPLWQLGYAVGGHWGDIEDCNAQLCFLNRSGDVLYRNTRVKGSWCAALPTSGSLGELLADSAAALCPRLGLLAAAGPAGTTTARMPCGSTERRHDNAACSVVQGWACGYEAPGAPSLTLPEGKAPLPVCSGGGLACAEQCCSWPCGCREVGHLISQHGCECCSSAHL